MKLFNLDSPLMQALNKMADLMWLNVLTLVCCIPIVTAGASLTAMNYMALKMARNEECYITKGFFKSFRENFKQATLIWLLLLLAFVILAGDFIILRNTEMRLGNMVQIVITAVAILISLTAMLVFPVLARFTNTIFGTLKNALFISLMQFPKTILMIVLYLLPAAVFLFFPQVIPLVFLFGLSLPGWLSAKLYSKFFKKLEDRIRAVNANEAGEEESGEDERIFRDELDPAIAGENHVE